MVKDKNAKNTLLTGKYAQLRDDLKNALSYGQNAVQGMEDSGACNFDSPALELPRWNRKLVEQAAEEAGTSCFIWHCYSSKLFVFNPCISAQGLPRSLKAEAMTKYLADLGYNSLTYSQMD